MSRKITGDDSRSVAFAVRLRPLNSAARYVRKRRIDFWGIFHYAKWLFVGTSGGYRHHCRLSI